MKKKDRGNKVFLMFFAGLILGITLGAVFGIILMGVELSKEQMAKAELSKWCGEKFEEIGDKCLETIDTTRTLCLFSNDLGLKERQDANEQNKVTGGKNGISS